MKHAARRWRVIALALAPWPLLAAAPLGILAAWKGRRATALAAAAVTGAGALVARDIAGRRQLVARPADLRVAHLNLLYRNERLADVAAALEQVDADVIAFSEYHPDHARELRASPLVDRYPHRIERPAWEAGGAGLWSRRPLAEVPGPPIVHETCAADVAIVGERSIRVATVHIVSPIHHTTQWARDLAVLAEPAWRPRGPSVMVGDYNAAWLHPELRDVLANGWRLAHRVAGRGLRPSWRADPPFVPFVRIDHAMVSDVVDVVDVEDFAIPGSDHRGFVVSVAAR